MTLHFIRYGDTLQSIADQVNLENPLYIKEFHNQKCAREDYIFEDLVVGKKLFLPDNLSIQKYNSKNDAPFKSPEKNPKIGFSPENLDTQYKVSVTESSLDNGKKSENSFSYTFSLKWMRNEFNYHTFHISKTNFSKIEDKLGNLASYSMQSLNPIEIQTNLKGEIVSISLLQKTIENFPKIKEKLLDQFPDQYAKIYIDEFEYVVLNQELFQKKMKQDWLLKTFFAPVRNEFKNGKSHFKMLLENEIVDINQTADNSENTDEISLSQDYTFQSIDFKGKYMLSKDKGLINSLEIKHSYSQYNVLYWADFKVDKIS